MKRLYICQLLPALVFMGIVGIWIADPRTSGVGAEAGTSPAVPADFYVSPVGNDAWSGRLPQPSCRRAGWPVCYLGTGPASCACPEGPLGKSRGKSAS